MGKVGERTLAEINMIGSRAAMILKLIFLANRRPSQIALALLFLTLSAVCWCIYDASCRIERQCESLRQRASGLRRSLNVSRIEYLSRLEETRSPTSTTGTASKGASAKGAEIRQMLQAELEDPSTKALLALSQRARLDAHYAFLFRLLVLDQGSRERLKELLVEKRLNLLRSSLERDDNTTGSPTNENSPADAAIKALLGVERYRQYEAYETHPGFYSAANDYVNSLQYIGEELNADQLGQLGQALGTLTKADIAAGGFSSLPESFVGSAKSFLSPNQFEALMRFQDQQAAWEAMRRFATSLKMRQSQGELIPTK